MITNQMRNHVDCAFDQHGDFHDRHSAMRDRLRSKVSVFSRANSDAWNDANLLNKGAHFLLVHGASPSSGWACLISNRTKPARGNNFSICVFGREALSMLLANFSDGLFRLRKFITIASEP